MEGCRGGYDKIMRRKISPYNPKLKPLAKALRKNMTFSEVLLWNELKQKKMLGHDFDRQRPIDNYIVDFYCKDLMTGRQEKAWIMCLGLLSTGYWNMTNENAKRNPPLRPSEEGNLPIQENQLVSK